MSFVTENQPKIERSPLLETIQGKTYLPGDSGFDAARLGWNLAMNPRPAVIVEAVSVADVQAAVRYAVEVNLPIAVMNTGHGAPRNADGAVLISIGALNDVQVDAETGIAKIGGGARWGDVVEPAYEAGFGVPCGSSPNVGVVGYTLGGGYGLMVRKHGLAIDHLRAVQLVTPAGELVNASEGENPDLFWAIRGGGGAFGVIVEATFELPKEPHVFGGTVMYPAERSLDVLRAFQRWTQDLDESVSSAFYVIGFPPLPFIPEPLRGRAFACISACATGDGEVHLEPIRNLDGIFMDTFRTMPFTDSAEIFRDPVDPLPAQGNGVLLRDLGEDSLEAFIAAIGDPLRSPNLKVEIRHVAGAAGRAAEGTTAIGDRRAAKYIAFTLGIPMPGVSLDMIRESADRIFATLGDQILCRGPLNWLGEAHVPCDSIRDALGEETYRRMCELKSLHDPENRFRFAGAGIPLAEA